LLIFSIPEVCFPWGMYANIQAPSWSLVRRYCVNSRCFCEGSVGKFFINYRREDASAEAVRISDWLATIFGPKERLLLQADLIEALALVELIEPRWIGLALSHALKRNSSKHF
jgi:hypothetical protein